MLKGTPQGILLRPQTSSWEELLSSLELSLQDAQSFFRGGRVILELGTLSLPEEDFRRLRQLLERYEMELWVILSEREEVTHLARSHGIRTRLPGTPLPRNKSEGVAGNALFVQRTLRSGQKLHHPGHIVLLGDVNAGAEIVAGGNVIIWGRVRGVVHAGAFGDESAVVCALDLMPSQLRIARYFSRAPEQRRRSPQPELARVEQGNIVAIPWKRTRE